jgi:hypothetical protein
VTGVHAQIVKRKLKTMVGLNLSVEKRSPVCQTVYSSLKPVDILKNKPPEAMTKTMFAEIEDQSVIFGFGNMKGAGELLVAYWNKIGEAYEL